MTDDSQTLPARRRWLRNPVIRFIVLATFMFAFMMAGMMLWPGDEPVEWRQTLVNSLVFALALMAGSLVAERRYGREALRDASHPHASAAMWTDVGVMALVVALAILIQKLFFQ